MKKIYLFPNLITAFGLSCGLFVIFKMNMLSPGQVDLQVFQTSAFLFLLAALADIFDGAIARLIRAESEFGLQFDSLADAVSFGVLPSVMMLKSLSFTGEKALAFAITASAMVYSICGVLRLARFNVTSQLVEGKTEEELLAQKKNFTGLPIPAAAAAAVSMNLFLLTQPFSIWGVVLTEEMRAFFLVGTMLLLGYFMVSRWKFPSVKMLHLRVRSFQLVFLTVLVAVVLFYGIFYQLPIVMTFISWAYIVVSLILSLIRKIAGKRVQSLEDFEPEADEFL